MSGIAYVLNMPIRLPSLNEYITKCRTNAHAGGQFKKNWQKMVECYIAEQMPGLQITKKVELHYHWHEPNTKRDLDNISGFGHKIIQDALVQADVLLDDGWEEIAGFSDTFHYDPTNPHITVFIQEVE